MNEQKTEQSETESVYDEIKVEKKVERTDSYFDGKVLELIGDRKSTRLNSSHVSISYAVFCLKKKKKKKRNKKDKK